MEKHGDIFEELLDFLAAEKYGREKGRCYDRYEICPVSVFKLMPVVVNTLLGVTRQAEQLQSDVIRGQYFTWSDDIGRAAIEMTGRYF